ncbi:hypothetical protein [Tunicatimonas pelagia]|uniref:hypothetical protein n=1 Tax=Tunicatimonas pelagia TaxID=931531 RepID=UPI0026666324|nr:hypothetical protein [Tunicatimonas pelagia]WKN45133.1 hypothetical protein P0M28_09180 [Tunicatimonas pelagia]
MKYISLFLLSIITHIVQASDLPQYGVWCFGKITLDNNVILEGKISYDLKFEAIKVKTDDLVRTYTAENITNFEIFDPIKYRHRKYVAVDHVMKEGYKRKTFFEVLSDGKISILRKSKYVRRPRVTEDYRAPHVYLNAVCRHTYYVYQGDKFVEIEDFVSQVMPMMTSHQEEVTSYVKQCKLKLKAIHEQMRVIHLYNQLTAQPEKSFLLSESMSEE